MNYLMLLFIVIALCGIGHELNGIRKALEKRKR